MLTSINKIMKQALLEIVNDKTLTSKEKSLIAKNAILDTVIVKHINKQKVKK